MKKAYLHGAISLRFVCWRKKRMNTGEDVAFQSRFSDVSIHFRLSEYELQWYRVDRATI